MTKERFNQSIINDLTAYLKAWYPLIYVISYEEERLEEYLRHIICEKHKDKKIELFTWNVVEGYSSLCDGKKIQPQDTDYGDYFNCLSFIENYNKNSGSIYILKDYHPAFTLDSANTIIRKIRNLIISIRDQSKSIIISVPPGTEKLCIPVELEKEIVIYRLPLPDFKEASVIFDEVISETFGGKIPNILKGSEKEQIIRAGLGLTRSEMANAFIRAGLKQKQFDKSSINTVLEEKRQIIEKSRILEYFPTDIEKKDVGGLNELKKWLDENSAMFDEKALEAGCDVPKGILLVGVPGCGKSLIAKTMASHWKMPLLRFDLSSVFGSLVGESEKNMKQALEVAELIAPSVLWVDEIEKGLTGMTSSFSGDSGTSQRVFGTLLSWMQDRNKPVFFIATANDISRISTSAPELLRAGRFDEIFFIDLPNKDERIEIFKIHLSKRKEEPSLFDLNSIADATSGFSGADIEQTVKDAKRMSYLASKNLTTELLIECAKQRIPTAVTMKDKIEELRKWAAIRAKMASSNENKEDIETFDEFEKKKLSMRKIQL